MSPDEAPKAEYSQGAIVAEGYVYLSGIHRTPGALKGIPHGTAPTTFRPQDCGFSLLNRKPGPSE